MASGFIVRLRPTGPWRLGPSSGARDRVDKVLHSDTLYSALTIAAEQIGILPEWLAATAEASEPIVRVASAFPFVGRTLLAPAPKHVWPPPSQAVRTRWKAARFVPLHVVPRLLAYESLKEDRWSVDPVSEAVLPVEKFGEVTPPFRVSIRRTAAVDRVTGVSAESASTACLEFAENAGMWCPVFCPLEWRDRVQSLFRFVADAGLGGERSLGWGRSAAPEFEELPGPLSSVASDAGEHHEVGYWLLSLFAPAPFDRVDWSRGSYALVRRSGRMDNKGALKVESAMVEEGSVLMAESMPAGFARNVAPEGSPHPVYRAGFAVAIPAPVRLPAFYERQSVAATEDPQLVSAPVPDSAPEPVQSAAMEIETAGSSPIVPDIPATPNILDQSVDPPTEDDPGPEPEALEIEPATAWSHTARLPEEPHFPAILGDADTTPEPEHAPAEETQATENEPVEDALADAVPAPEPKQFVVETEPVSEQIAPEIAADGGAFEDAPSIPEADREKPEEAQ